MSNDETIDLESMPSNEVTDLEDIPDQTPEPDFGD